MFPTLGSFPAFYTYQKLHSSKRSKCSKLFDRKGVRVFKCKELQKTLHFKS